MNFRTCGLLAIAAGGPALGMRPGVRERLERCDACGDSEMRQRDVRLMRVEVREHRHLDWRWAAAAAVAIADLVGFPARAAAATLVPVLDWQPCPDPSQSGFDCATAQVPLDYGDPQGATVELAVIRHPATEPANRLGALFFNPGGPGSSGTVQLPQWLEFFPATLRARFDLISWDPRGIGASTAVLCFATPEEVQQLSAGLP